MAKAIKSSNNKKTSDEAHSASLYARSLIEASLDPLLTISVEGKIIDVNKATEQVTGCAREQLIGNDFSDYFTEPEKSRAIYAKICSERFVKDYPLLLKNPYGKVPVEVSGGPIKDTIGAITGFAIFLRDVTGRKQLENDLLNLARFPSENPYAVLRVNKEGEVIYANPESQKLPEKIRPSMGQIVPEAWHKHITDSLASNHRLDFEATADGRWFLFKAAPIISEGYVNIYGTDITASKKAEEVLKENEKLYRTVFDNSQDGFQLFELIYDDAGKPIDLKFLRVNHAYEKIIGVQASDIIGKTARYISPNCESIWFEVPDRVVKTGRSEHVELYNKDVNKTLDSYYFQYSKNLVGTLFRDISESKKTEEKLRAVSIYSRSLIEASLDPLVTISPEGKITDVNEATIKVTGVSREELIGTDFSNYFTEPLKAREGYLQVFAMGSVTDYPLTIHHKYGKLTDVLYNASVYKDAEGKVLGVFAAARDVTESKRVMRDFVETKNFLDNILQSSTKYSIIGKDLDHKILSWNEGAERNYGYSAEEIIGRDSSILHIPEDIKSGKVAQLLKTAYEKGLAEGEFLRVRKDGTRFMASVVVTRRNDSNGRAIGYLLMSNDISENKQAEEQLKQASQYSRSLIEASLDPLVTINVSGKITDVNKATEEVTGRAREELIGSDFSDYFTEPKMARAGYQKVFTDGFVRDYPLAILHKSGRITDVLYNASVYRNEAGQIQGVFAAARDVTERKQAEDQLKSVSLYSRSLIEASLDPLVTISAEGKITDVNKSTEEVTGYSREQLIGSDFSDYFTEPEKARAGYKQVFTEGFVRDYALAIRHKSGKITDVLYNARVYRNEAGEIQGIFAAARDITERKLAEQKLLAASLYSRSLIEASLDPLVTISRDGKITDVNKATEDVTGYTREELISSDFSDYFTEPQEARAGYQKVFTEGLVKDYPLAIRHKSGRITDVLYNASIYRNENGEIQGIFAAARDVTERKKAEENVRAASLYSRSLIEASLDPLVTINAEGKITDVNESTEEVTGFSREQLIGSDFSDYFTEPEKAREGYQKVFTEGLVKDYPLAIRHKSGRITDVLYNASIYRNPQGDIQGVFAAARDVTERKVMENEIKLTLEKLKQSNSELEQFAYVASHDLQEPLRMVASYVQLLERRYKGKLDADADEFIAYAVDGANRMRGLIDDLLTYSRVARLGKPFEPTDIESTLNIVLLNLQASIKENNAVVTHDKLPVVVADGGQLVQLLQNLIGNAIKFHGKDPPHVHVSAQVKENEYLFSVCDNGIGIAPEYYDRLFKIFQRLHTREEYPGSGIGLAVCKRIVERHGGRIWIESQVGKGSTIYFTLNRQKGVDKSFEKS